MSEVYYHCAPNTLRKGSIIEPGNWGRLLPTHIAAPNAIPLIPHREAALEFARQALAPEKVSRFDCVFVLPDIQSAIDYRAVHDPRGMIYQVEALSDDEASHDRLSYRQCVPKGRKPHMADYRLTDLIMNGPLFPALLERPRKYWLETPTECVEILLPWPVRVIGVVG